MALTYAQVIDKIEQEIQDTTNLIYDATELDQALTAGLERISRVRPYPVKYTFSTTADSKKLTIADHHRYNILSIGKWPGPHLEFRVNKNPEQKRNFYIEGNNEYIVLDIDSYPSALESVYVWLNRLHVLQATTGTNDGAGLIDNTGGYAAGISTIHVDGLDNAKTVLADTRLAITGDSTVYTIIDDATTSANDQGECDLNITPPLAAAVLNDVVVTLSLHPSTLSWDLEEALIKITAGLASISKAHKLVNQAHAAIASLTTAGAAVALVDGRIDQAILDLAAGRLVIPTVNIGEAVGGYANYASREIAAAISRLSEGRGSFDKAGFEMRISGAAANLIAQGRLLIAEAERFLWKYTKERITFSYPRV